MYGDIQPSDFPDQTNPELLERLARAAPAFGALSNSFVAALGLTLGIDKQGRDSTFPIGLIRSINFPIETFHW